MKIPAHVVSPMPNNNKGAQNALLQSVAEFSNEQSESPKDFFAAMKSLQNLIKPQKDNEQRMDQSKDSTSSKTNMIASKVAGLKFVDPKNEGAELLEPEQEASTELMQSTDIKAPKSELNSNLKAVSVDKPVPIENELGGIEFRETNDQSEHLPVKSDTALHESKTLDRIDNGIANNAGTRAASQNDTLAILTQQTRTEKNQSLNSSVSLPPAATKPIPPANKRNSMELTALGTNAGRSIDNATPTAPVHRAAMSNDENVRRPEAPQFELGLAIKSEAKPVDQAPLNQNHVATKSEARLEFRLQQSHLRVETPSEFRPSIENTPQIQTKDAAIPQSSTANGPAMQPTAAPPLAAAKDISAQVSRHLNSELLNMDLRTQIVTERAATGSINSSVLTLQLHPIGLGRVQAEIRKEGELVRIKLTVEAKGTFEILKNDIDALKTAMRALGTAEGDVMLTQGNINRLPSDAANNGQSFFANERNNQSAMQGQQDRAPNGHPGRHPEGDEPSPALRNSNQTTLGADNTVTI